VRYMHVKGFLNLKFLSFCLFLSTYFLRGVCVWVGGGRYEREK
jgi:hypothetical protein